MEAAVYWRDSWQSAQEEAKKANTAPVLELYMEGCPHCSTCTGDPRRPGGGQAVNTNFIPVRLDGRSHMDIVKKFNVTGAPTTLVFGADGKELHRFPGLLSAAWTI